VISVTSRESWELVNLPGRENFWISGFPLLIRKELYSIPGQEEFNPWHPRIPYW
jgi:hypothetical protein